MIYDARGNRMEVEPIAFAPPVDRYQERMDAWVKMYWSLTPEQRSQYDICAVRHEGDE